MHGKYKYLIPLVSYPVHSLKKTINKICDEMSAEGQINDLNIFRDYIIENDLSQIQEQYTQIFDMNPGTCLDLGWHLYGENYDRGAFMVRIRELLREQGLTESSELPDHLTHILAILDALSQKDQFDFGKTYVLPALKKILDGFQETHNPYKNLIQFINTIFQKQFQVGEA